MSSVLLSVRNVSAGYGRLPVLHGVSFDVHRGEVSCVAGPNGAGKTTLARTLSGLLRAWSGTILLEGRDISGLPAEKVVRLGLSHVPQDRRIFPGLTVRENLIIGACPVGRGAGEWARLEVGRWMDRFPILRARAEQRAGVLSGGEQQILAICRSLMARPSLVVMDEPTLGLSPATSETCLALVEELRDEGRTILLMIQSATERVRRLADSMYLIGSGELVDRGRPGDPPSPGSGWSAAGSPRSFSVGHRRDRASLRIRLALLPSGGPGA